MEKILERYEHYSYAEKAIMSSDFESQGNWCHEYGKLKAKVEVLSKSQRHLMGEQLDSLNLKELQQLEHQLEISMKHIRSRKSQVMFDSIAELQRKEKALREQNKNLERELMEKQKAKVLTQQPQQQPQPQPQRQPHCWQQAQTSTSSPPPLLAEPHPTLNIGSYQRRAAPAGHDEEIAQAQARISNSLLPPWMLRHLND